MHSRTVDVYSFWGTSVISLMVSLLVSDSPDLHVPGKVFTVYDPACGTGGILTETERKLLEINPRAKVHMFGQEINLKSHAVCTSDMLIKGQDASNIVRDDTLANDGFPDQRFAYCAANPPFGVDWAASMDAVKKEAARGKAGRFPGGYPAKGDGQMLFLQHLVAKAKTADEGGGRVTVVLNGSPLFSGDAESGESNIRKWLFENDLVEAIIGLPDQLFYNTGINTYVWVLATAKRPERQGVVQLIDARDLFVKMPKSLGNKRNELTQEHIQEIVSTYESMTVNGRSKVLRNEEFGYTKVTVERPLRLRYGLSDETRRALADSKPLSKVEEALRQKLLNAVADSPDWSTLDRAEALSHIDRWATAAGKLTKAVKDAVLSCVSVRDAAGSPVPDPKLGFLPDTALRDVEYVPLEEDIDAYLRREVAPFAPDAWHAQGNDKVGYEIPFTRLFYKYQPPRLLEEIDDEIRASQQRILELLTEEAR